MSSSKQVPDRRVSDRVNEILTGWWRIAEGKFERCKTLDLSLDGALIVLDKSVADSTQIELHLDMEDGWSCEVLGTVLWQRPIFFGRQQLTAISYRFKKSEHQSMFGLWMQRRLVEEAKSIDSHLAPIVLSAPKPTLKPSIEPAPQLEIVESPWKKTFSQLTAKIPWFESSPLPAERRTEARGQVGLKVQCETDAETFGAGFLNVSLSGACLFVSRSENSPNPVGGIFGRKNSVTIATQSKIDLIVPSHSLLLGNRRCQAEVVWSRQANLRGSEDLEGVVLGLRFLPRPALIRQTFIGDLLKRINYNVRQVRAELRFPKAIPAIVMTEQGEKLKGQTVDISIGGLQICLPEELFTPSNITVTLDLGPEETVVRQVVMSARLLRRRLDNRGRNCYAVAFRKGQVQEHLELSRWLAQLLRVQNLDELIPNFSHSSENRENG